MSEIKASCRCGAKINIQCNQGDVWVSQQLEKFLKAHQVCLEGGKTNTWHIPSVWYPDESKAAKQTPGYIEMKISGTKVRIENDEDLDIFGVVDDLIKPALLGLGFLQTAINEVLVTENGGGE